MEYLGDGEQEIKDLRGERCVGKLQWDVQTGERRCELKMGCTKELEKFGEVGKRCGSVGREVWEERMKEGEGK